MWPQARRHQNVIGEYFISERSQLRHRYKSLHMPLLSGFSTTFWSLASGICSHSDTRVSEREWEPALMLANNPGFPMRSGLCAGQSHSSTPKWKKHFYLFIFSWPGFVNGCIVILQQIYLFPSCPLQRSQTELKPWHCGSPLDPGPAGRTIFAFCNTL